MWPESLKTAIFIFFRIFSPGRPKILPFLATIGYSLALLDIPEAESNPPEAHRGEGGKCSRARGRCCRAISHIWDPPTHYHYQHISHTPVDPWRGRRICWYGLLVLFMCLWFCWYGLFVGPPLGPFWPWAQTLALGHFPSVALYGGFAV